MANYSSAIKERGTPTMDAREAYSVRRKKLYVLQSVRHGCDYSDFLTGGHQTLTLSDKKSSIVDRRGIEAAARYDWPGQAA